MKVDGFKKVDYPTLQEEIKKVYDSDKLPEIKIASDINVKSVQTVKNAFSPTDQIVSDQVLTNILDMVGLDSFIVWEKGERTYYIKTK